MAVTRLDERPIHLGLGATAVVQPPFTGMEWYEGYGRRHGGDGAEGRLVSEYTFSADWTAWEVHPHGDEVVYVLSGRVRLHQEFPDGRLQAVECGPGEYAINPPGVWHTADVIDGPVKALFITAGLGTEHKER